MPRGNSSVLFLATLCVGCGGVQGVPQRLVGDWVGRPETAAERTEREWPGSGPDGGQTDQSAPTDLEAYAVEVRMALGADGRAVLRIDGGRERVGEWEATPGEGLRGLLDLSLAPEENGQGRGADAPHERRRFNIQLLESPERIVLHEEGADRRFGRLLFSRAGGSAAAPPNE